MDRHCFDANPDSDLDRHRNAESDPDADRHQNDTEPQQWKKPLAGLDGKSVHVCELNPLDLHGRHNVLPWNALPGI